MKKIRKAQMKKGGGQNKKPTFQQEKETEERGKGGGSRTIKNWGQAIAQGRGSKEKKKDNGKRAPSVEGLKTGVK